jgi:hypothetical protein
MTGTKTLYATTLVLAGMAGFSSGWAVRPPERVLLSREDAMMLSYESAFRMADADREALRAVVRDYFARLDALSRDFDRKFESQVGAVEDEMDARVARILTPDKRR